MSFGSDLDNYDWEDDEDELLLCGVCGNEKLHDVCDNCFSHE